MSHQLFKMLLLLVCSLASVCAQGQQGNTSPIEANKVREATIRSVAVEFQIVEDVAEGAISSTLPQGAVKQPAPITPAKPTKLESKNRLLISGKKTRFERNHPIWSPDTGQATVRALVNTMDGEYEKTLYPVGINKPERPEGFIGRNAQSHDIKSYLIAPLTLWYRGHEPTISPYFLGDFRVAGKSAVIRGRECVEATLGSGAEVVSIWFDSSAGSVPRRYRVENKGRTRQQVDIDYQQDPAGFWIPTSWVRNEFGSEGRLLVTTKGQVTSTNLNLEYPKEQFDIRFPAGALVYNARERKDYIVQEDGVTMQEYDITKGELRSETTYQPGTPWLRRNLTWLIVAGCCVIVLAFLALSRRGKKSQDYQSPQVS